MTEQIHLIAYTFLIEDTSGRDMRDQRIEDEHGFFTDLDEAQRLVDRLNGPARARFESRQRGLAYEHLVKTEHYEAREREIAAIEAAGLVPSINHFQNPGEFRERTWDPAKAEDRFAVLTLHPGTAPALAAAAQDRP